MDVSVGGRVVGVGGMLCGADWGVLSTTLLVGVGAAGVGAGGVGLAIHPANIKLTRKITLRMRIDVTSVMMLTRLRHNKSVVQG